MRKNTARPTKDDLSKCDVEECSVAKASQLSVARSETAPTSAHARLGVSEQARRQKDARRTVDDRKVADVQVHVRLLGQLPLRARDGQTRGRGAAAACEHRDSQSVYSTGMLRFLYLCPRVCQCLKARFETQVSIRSRQTGSLICAYGKQVLVHGEKSMPVGQPVGKKSNVFLAHTHGGWEAFQK